MRVPRKGALNIEMERHWESKNGYKIWFTDKGSFQSFNICQSKDTPAINYQIY